jgi:hypothetical protein
MPAGVPAGVLTVGWGIGVSVSPLPTSYWRIVGRTRS